MLLSKKVKSENHKASQSIDTILKI